IALLGGLTTITTTQIANSSPDQNDTGSNSSSGSSSITTSATVATGHYTTPQTINFTSSVSGGEVKCTTDGNDPTNATPTWSATHIWALAGATIKCGTFVNGTLSGSIQSYTYSYSPFKSGQTTSYATGDDGATQNGVARSYTDNGNGTVTDNSTGLLWQKCSRGQNNDSTCSGTATTTNWTDAGNYCSSLSLGGKTWKLPTSMEFETLPSYGVYNPSINTTFFPNTSGNYYWSSTTFTPNTSKAWGVYFGLGDVGNIDKTSNNYVRCISSSNSNRLSIYIDNSDGTITDKSNGLIWQKCSIGLSGTNCESGSASTSIWTVSVTTCSGLSLASRSWRLPSVLELSSLMDKSLSSFPNINISFFPATGSNVYWSSTTSPSDSANGFGVHFSSSFVGQGVKSTSRLTRCVSGP
ncbi:MAG: DUF1566 domain-containing protein, partial [Leptospiraceae bacterium]|nr:DUF1566 domain-containing protein [Leptospiraceae bacterium]